MPTREQVCELLDEGLDYPAVGDRLGIPPGQAYMIATGRPADGSGTPSERERRGPLLPGSSQHLANPPNENPTAKKTVHDWIASRVAADAPMRAAAKKNAAQDT